MLPMGYLLNNKYVIDKCLGSGGFGITYLGINRYSGEEFAVKEFFPNQFSSRGTNQVYITPNNSKDEGIYYKYLKRFKEEAELLEKLRHQNIVQVEEYFECNNSGYIVMPYIDGMDLEKYLEKKSSLNQEEILQIINPILDGLREVHSKGYLHRDISPDNIYMRNNSIPMLIDFGSARFYMAKNSGALSAILKIGYSPVEQYTTNNEQNAASDIYALSAVIYRMITGQKPVDAVARQTAMVKRQPSSMINLEKEYQGKYSQSFLKAVMKGLNIEQDKRFQNIKTFRSGLHKNSNSLIPNDEKDDKPPVQIIHIVIWGLTFVFMLLAIIGLVE